MQQSAKIQQRPRIDTAEVGKFYCRSLGPGHPKRNTDSSGTHTVRRIVNAALGAGAPAQRLNAVGDKIAILQYSLDRQFPTVKRVKPVVDRDSRTLGILCGVPTILTAIFS